MISRGLITCKINNEKEETCEACILGKHARSPFSSQSESRASKIGEIRVSDICGPMPTPTFDGFKYLITFTDDYSRYTRGFLIKHKNEALDCWKIYTNRIKNITGRWPDTIRSDNGRKYKNKEFEKFLEEIGTERQLTTPHTPQQNGISERLNRTILGRLRAMLFDAKAPAYLWGEAARTVIHINNRIISKATNDKTPYMMYNRPPSMIKHTHSVQPHTRMSTRKNAAN